MIDVGGPSMLRAAAKNFAHVAAVSSPEQYSVVLGERCRVLRQVAPRKNPGVDARVQRLDTAAEHLGRLGHLLDARHIETLAFQERRRAARRDELPAEVGQAARKVVDAGLLPDADQRTGHRSPTTCGRTRCSTS